MWRVTVLLGVCACGRIGFDPIDDNTVSDAPADSMTQQIAQQHYLKASNPGLADGFGNAIALSADASTLVVAASNEAGGSIGINGDQSDDSAGASGAVYVFVRSGAGWVQQAYLKASNTNNSDAFGRDVSLSADGSTLAVGADLEDSAATGIDGNQADNSAMNAGAAYVFTRTGTTWSQQAYVKASNTGPTDSFGYRIALSGDGNTLAVGAHTEDGGATGINGPQNDAVMNSGAVYVYSRTGTVWTQQAYVKASNPDVGEAFGFSLALSHDGTSSV
ncbi:MAG: FG-GAP repeat protein, partial [Kofleriaceae bacterium]